MTKKISMITKKFPETKVPADLSKAFSAHPIAKRKWNDLAPLARRDFITWIESAKQPETRFRRIAKTCSVLPAGKRRPCCYAVVPMKLYQALGSNPKAKAQWKNVTSEDKRDFIDWIELSSDKQAHQQRIEKVCSMLVSGKKVLDPSI